MSNVTKPEPIAIIGIGCRFPGDACNPDKFWKMLCEGKDAIVDVPKDRWDSRRYYDPQPNTAAKMYVKQGGFLREKWEDFDAAFFHISPREANFLDPQQRLLLEVTWEALEDAGVVPQNIGNTDTGVFIGAFTTDWQSLHNKPFNLNHCGMYSGINGSMTILSARLAYFFDLKGPCLTVDTACSSSLVAVHLACQNIWQKNCSLAIAGGVNAMLIPETTIAMSKGRFLNPEGRCRPFDASAMGYVRGEGGGVVILKPLADALRDQDPIYAVIRGTGVNHDGYTQGIAQPNPEAQRTLISKVLRDSGVNPSEVHYVEAHGTGTPVGDPIEAMALNNVLQDPSRKFPCYLGAVKSNIGHLEAAAGIAGLIKAALCLKHKKIPPNLHFHMPNPKIPFEKYCLKVPIEMHSFPESTSSLFAGVNAFGYGGTNAHAILESYDDVNKTPSTSVPEPLVVPFSGKNLDALKESVKNIREYLESNAEANLCDIVYTLSKKRSLFPYRLAICAQTTAELKRKLDSIVEESSVEGTFQGKVLEAKPKLAFVYTGMGPQWWGMGKELLKESEDFLKIIRYCDEKLLPVSGWSLLEELQKNENDSRMDDPVVAQVCHYAIQIALTHLMKSRGIVPDVILGHSIGEVAAGYAAGVLGLEEGLQLAFHRATIQSSQKNKGTMLAVGMSLAEVKKILTDFQDTISVAADNGPQSVTLAGTKENLQQIVDILEPKNVFYRFLKVNIAYHSHHMETLQSQVHDTLHFIQSKKPTTTLISTVTGKELGQMPMDSKYWWLNIRQPVLFGKAIQTAVEKGCNLFVEIGPHPVLASFIKENLISCQKEGETISTLNRKKGEMNSLMECLGALFVKGYPLKQKTEGTLIRLPFYPWQRKTHWIESEESLQYRRSANNHVMLSRRIKSPQPTWQVEVNKNFFPWLEDHQIDGTIVFPGAGYIEAGLAIHGTFPCVMEDITFEKMLIIQKEKESILQTSLDEQTKIFKVHSIGDGNTWDWTCHATGKFSSHAPKQCLENVELEKLKLLKYVDRDEIYNQFAEKGLEYGPSFQSIAKLWKGTREALSEIEIADTSDTYHLHPTLLDAAFQTLIGTVDEKIVSEGLIIPSRIDQITFFSAPKDIAFCYAKLTKLTHNKITGELILCDAEGKVCTKIKGLECRLLLKPSAKNESNLLYQLEWEEKPLDTDKVHQENINWLASQDLAKCLVGCSTFNMTQLLTHENAEQLLYPYKDSENLNILLGFTVEGLAIPQAHEEIQAVNSCVNLVKSIVATRGEKPTTLWIVTQGALRGASLWGLCRVIRQEVPHLRIRLIDFDLLDSEILAKELQYLTSDDEIKWTHGKRMTCKMKKKTSEDSMERNLSSFSLELKTPGLIESLYYKEIEKNAPSAHEVGIQVHSTSLNFKDLMKVLGMLDQNVLEGTFFGNSFGMECSGTIVSLGSKVKNYSIGDKVCAFVPNTFQSYLTVPANCIYATPPHTSFDEAPIYIPFITVLRALKECAQLKKGEWILIHSATGAVGLAAIQYAQYVGANIIATAGNDEKREVLRGLGIRYCADSRSVAFAEEVIKWTDGKGVDVILNSLSGEALSKSWTLLASYGRFIEIGKRDISMNSPLAMRYFNNNTSFSSIDLDRTFIDNPKLIQRLLKETHQLFDKEVFKALPCEIFPANQPIEAFQFMARSKHIGKIMLKFEGVTVQGIPLKKDIPIVNGASSYMVTGGLSGFGLSVASWLAEKGAKHLILVGRRGASTTEAKNVVERLRKDGVHVKIAAVDITDFEQMNILFNECDKEMPPLKGIVHSAMVLDDAFISQVTSHSIQQVLSPKIAGSLNLHRLTQNRSLDFFVLFSSISSLIGNPGQGSYAAANSFLDRFCDHRKSLSLPALTINWGALDAGILARNSQVAKHLESHGIKGIPKKSALRILENAIRENQSQVCAMDVNWGTLMQRMPTIKQSKVFSEFLSENEGGVGTMNLMDELSKMEESQRLDFVIELIKETVAKTLRMDPSKLDITMKLNNLGMDSLMAMELQTTLEINMGIKIPTMELMKGPSIKHLAQIFLRS